MIQMAMEFPITELEDGTNPEDRGSYLSRFSELGYGVWNGFLAHE